MAMTVAMARRGSFLRMTVRSLRVGLLDVPAEHNSELENT